MPPIISTPTPRRVDAGLHPWQRTIFTIIYEAETRAGKAFDIALLVTIVLSVIAVMVESVPSISRDAAEWLRATEWTFTLLFTVEYILRLIAVRRPMKYGTSFFGLVDLLAIVPTYLTLLPIFDGVQALIVIRSLRLVRIFRVLKLVRYLSEAEALMVALRETAAKIVVFFVVVITLMLILGSLMYLVEGSRPDSHFTSIPKGVYWAIVTMTTVGYGDVTPQTVAGQFIASVAMILGYSIIIVPTGIFSVEVIMARDRSATTRTCPTCARGGHADDALYCKFCSAPL